MAAVKRTICATAISKPDHLEAISLHFHLHIPLSVCCVYTPPNPDSTHMFLLVSYLSDLATPPCSDIIVVGDFILPDIEWDTLSAAPHSSEHFCDFVFNNNLIDKPTHIKGNILDLIITNMLKPSNSGNKYQLSQPFDALRPLYVSKADYNGLCSYLMDVVIIWSYLKNIIFTGMNGYIPKVRHRKCQYPC